MTNGYGSIFFRVIIDRNAKWRSNFILSAIAFSNRTAIIIFTRKSVCEFLKNFFSNFCESIFSLTEEWQLQWSNPWRNFKTIRVSPSSILLRYGLAQHRKHRAINSKVGSKTCGVNTSFVTGSRYFNSFPKTVHTDSNQNRFDTQVRRVLFRPKGKSYSISTVRLL